MISSTTFLSRGAVPLLLLLLAGCAATKKVVTERPPQAVEQTRIAVLPVANLTGARAPVEEIRTSLVQNLRRRGIALLEDDAMDAVMARHRMRYVGGIDGKTARAFHEETETTAILITSLELYNTRVPPKIAFTCRLVSAENPPVILWMDTAGLAGDQSPGLLRLGVIEEPPKLLEKAARSLSGSLADALTGRKTRGASRRHLQPRIAFRSPILDSGGRHTVAVLPFFNRSARSNAGEIVALHFVRELTRASSFNVMEPGVVREELLKFRIIMEDGVSLSDAALLLTSLDTDLVVTGNVLDYQDIPESWGSPSVDFSAWMIEKRSREVVWASKSAGKGNDGVFFFDWRRMYTANAVAARMARTVVEMIAP